MSLNWLFDSLNSVFIGLGFNVGLDLLPIKLPRVEGITIFS